MKYQVKDFARKFRILAGDTSEDTPDEFIINGLNWAFNSLPSVPKLGKAFSKHYTFNLDAKGNYKWKLNGDFRRLTDLPMLNFYTSNGEEPCPITICARSNVDFYKKNGVIAMKQPGEPCEYTIEQEDDDIYLVLDRPLDIPLIIDYIAFGYPAPVDSIDDEIEISAPIENLVLHTLRKVWFEEADDLGFAGAFTDYMDNKMLPEVIQMLNKRFGTEEPTILGEV